MTEDLTQTNGSSSISDPPPLSGGSVPQGAHAEVSGFGPLCALRQDQTLRVLWSLPSTDISLVRQHNLRVRRIPRCTSYGPNKPHDWAHRRLSARASQFFSPLSFQPFDSFAGYYQQLRSALGFLFASSTLVCRPFGFTSNLQARHSTSACRPVSSSLLRLHLGSSSLQLHRASSSLRHCLGQSSLCLCHRHIGLRLCPFGYVWLLLPLCSTSVLSRTVASVPPGSPSPPAPTLSDIPLVLPGLYTKASPWLLPPLSPPWAFIQLSFLRLLLKPCMTMSLCWFELCAIKIHYTLHLMWLLEYSIIACDWLLAYKSFSTASLHTLVH